MTQFLFITHNKIAMEMAEQLIGVTMQEQGVSRIVAVDMPGAMPARRSGLNRVSTLTIALASLGGVVLAGVVAHGAWQARRAGPKRASAPRAEPSAQDPRSHDEAPAQEASSESTSDGPMAPVRRLLPAHAVAARRLDRCLRDAEDGCAAQRRGTLGARCRPSAMLAASSSSSKACNVDTARWEAPMAGARYSELQAGIQLANRTGALNEIEYSEFVQRVQTFAEAIGAAADFPDMLDVMARARELDAFASPHDAQLAVHLHARGAAWSVGYMQQHARRHGFVPGVVAGRLVYPRAKRAAPPVLALTFDSQAALADEPDQAAVRELTLAFDVPQTDPSVEPFKAWQAAAQALAVGMDAAIVDDNERPLSGEGFAAIGAELGQLYAALEAHDLAAGSAAARRLFS